MRKASALVLSVAALFAATTGALAIGWSGILLYQKDGAVIGDKLGYSVAGAGDVNADGINDFIVGAYDADPGGRNNAGSAYVYDGATGTLLFQKDGTGYNDNFGLSVAGAGDVNGDGNDDFIIGACNADPGGLSQAGSAYVYDGATGSLLYQRDGTAANDGLGYSVAGAGDVNGDGKGDFIIGASDADPGGRPEAGSVYVYDGPTGALLYQKDGAVAHDHFGHSVAGAGDVNGDGKDDFIIGAHTVDVGDQVSAGSAYVYDGATGTLLYQKDGAAANDHFGICTAGAGDVNGDDRDDFVVGAFYADPGGRNNAGSAYVYDGLTGALLHQVDGANAGDRLGTFVSGAGDANGDGIGDFIIGADGCDAGGEPDAGTAYVYDGPTGVLLYQKNGTATGDRLGYSVAGVGDLNDDGRDDFIIGAFTADPGDLPDAGSAYVIGLVCSCPFQCDYDEDGFLTALDLSALIDVLFGGSLEVQDPECPTSRGDFNNDWFPDALDLSGLIDHLFAGGEGPSDPCNP